MDSIKKNSLVKVLLGVVFLLSMNACATAPVQEMSDARQAIQVAKSVGADEHSPFNLAQAKRFLKKAEHALHSGEYKKARVNALAAKHEAFQAQQYATVTKY
jgi:hypothetical protein